MSAKHVRLRRSTQWHAERGVRIGRKVAWRVLGFASPKAYRLWRDERIRHEIAAGRRHGVFRESPTSAVWLAAQPRAFRAMVQPVGTLSATVYMQAKVSTMTLEPQWQVSADGSTWRNAKAPNNAASVVAVTGTGSNVSDTIVVTAPDAVYGFPYARCSVVSRVASAVDSNDQYNVSYNYLRRGYAP